MAKQKSSTVLRTIKRHSRSALIVRLLSLLIICLGLGTAQAQQTAFTYQGKLTDGGSAANGNYDLQFALFDSQKDGTQISTTQTLASVSVSAGIFTVSLDFGANAFNGASRYLEIGARPSGAGSFTLLTPRQPIASTPYAVRSLSTATADLATNTQQLGGVTAGQYVQTSDARMSDARPPTGGSSNYIQNGTSPQSAANFSIAGNGTAAGTLSGNVINAGTQFNLNGNRVFAITGAGFWTNGNTFAGVGAGTSNTPSSTVNAGNFNSFFGLNAGAANTTGALNSFFGANSGSKNTTGGGNSFFGIFTGNANTSGYDNSFFGDQAGAFNTTGNENSFFGVIAGQQNTTGALNSFFGSQAGESNSSGTGNSFFGFQSGAGNNQGSDNSFFGRGAGLGDFSGNNSTFLGGYATGTDGTINSTAVGYRAMVTQNNSLVLGSINGVNGAFADTKVGIGITAPLFKLHLVDPANTGLRVQTNVGGGTVASFGGFGDFSVDAAGVPGGRFVVKESGAVGIGNNNPAAKLDVNGTVRIGTLGGGGTTQLCWNISFVVSQCSSSLRYKTDLHPFTGGMNVVNRLQPLTFRWKADQSLDLGFGAEDVAAVEPLLVTRNASGEVEGVKYDRLSAVFINALKEQQAQIERQQAEATGQRNQIALLRMANEALNARLRSVEKALKKHSATRRHHSSH